jgi:hypothetical protein
MHTARGTRTKARFGIMLSEHQRCHLVEKLRHTLLACTRQVF